MKKIVYLILAVLFLFPIVAKADVGAPEIKAYTVVSKSGQDEPYYDWDLTEKGIVPAGQEVEINMEEKIDGVLYGISYNTLNGYIIKLSDFKVSKGQELGTSEAKYVAKVFAKDGLVVYAGPSYINEEVGKLAYGDDIKVGEFEGDAWLYVEKGSIKGYVDTGFGSGFGVGILTKGDKIDAVTNKIYNEYYTLSYRFRGAILVYEDGEYKQISYIGVPYEGNAATTTKDCKFYEDGRIEWTQIQALYGNEIGVIPAGTTIKPIYEGRDHYFSYYVEYNGKKGWIKYEDYNTGCVDFYSASQDPTEEPSEIKKEVYVTDLAIDKVDDDKQEFKFTTKEIVIGSIILGAAIVLTAIVTMILVNKKKKA